MIVRMSKIMVMGPLELLMETLTLIHGLGIMQVDEEITVDADDESPVPFSLLPEKKSALQHQLYEKLENKIDELQSCLVPSVFIHGEDVPIIAESKLLSILPFHLAEIKKRKEVMDTLQQQIAEHEAYLVFVEAVGQLDNGGMQNDIRCIGVQLEKKEDAARLQEMLDREYKGKAAFEVVSGTDEKSVVGVVMVEADVAGDIREAMKNKNLALFYSPDDVHRLPFSKQHEIVVSRVRKKKAQLKHLQRQQEDFARRWLPAYLKTREWIESRLSLIKLTAAVVRTRMCFFIYGWVPEADFRVLDEQLREQFQDLVVVEESELVEQDFSRIPTALHNPAYFEPFELFTRLLPMPPYASFDLTPFIGIFFPVFFGMMLGDIGYGVILLVGSVCLVRRSANRKNLRDAGKILFISSLYVIVFGLLYGEFFGTVGHEYFGLKPVFFDRQASIIPMLCFAVAAGVVHIIIGLILGVIVSLRRQLKKEALLKLVNIFIVFCITILVVSYFTSSMEQVRKPLFLTIVIVTPALLLVGGLMAPLELLKNVGNIISYARIMAVGLTSVLLAFVANYIAGRMGSVWAGIIVALLLHVFNLLLGVFAPTIHALRLHYVEFLSKFMESGGKEFKPLGRKQ